MSRGGDFTGFRWITCRCGKEWYAFVRDTSQELVDVILDIREHSLCKACEVAIGQARNCCPQMSERGACRLTWNHTGRCEPLPAPPPVAMAELHRRAAAGDDTPIRLADYGWDPAS